MVVSYFFKKKTHNGIGGDVGKQLEHRLNSAVFMASCGSSMTVQEDKILW